MDTNARRRRAHATIADTHTNFFSHDVNMYTEMPPSSLSLSEFNELALERVQLLRVIEEAALKGHTYFSDEWKNCIKDDLLKRNLKKFARLMNGNNGNSELDIQARRADFYSHWILRMAYCRSEELRRWFISRELEWFKIKFSAQSAAGVQMFLKLNNLEYVPISAEDKEEISEYLMDASGMTDAVVTTTNFYKVPFMEVCSLVKARKVYLKKRFAYVSVTDLVVCIQNVFRSKMSEVLTKMERKIHLLDDDRFNNTLLNLHRAHTGREYVASTNKDGIHLSELDQIAKKHFPLCMRHMHETFRANHHLKHGGRLTYGLFLKAIGLLYEQTLELWREEFTKVMTLEKFNKEHVYNIRHMYGQVGNMVNYSAYSCMKIILGSISPGDCHGCPFKHFDAEHLKVKLTEHGVSSEGVKEILNLTKGNHFQVACTKYFEYVHSQPPNLTINHPNQYFDESRSLAKEKTNVKKEK